MKKMLLVLMLVFIVTGCSEAQKTVAISNIKPLEQQFIQPNQEWLDAYGDSFESKVAFNFAVHRNNELVIAKTINNLHPKVDPNETTLEERVKYLEDNAITRYIDPEATVNPDEIYVQPAGTTKPVKMK